MIAPRLTLCSSLLKWLLFHFGLLLALVSLGLKLLNGGGGRREPSLGLPLPSGRLLPLKIVCALISRMAILDLSATSAWNLQVYNV